MKYIIDTGMHVYERQYDNDYEAAFDNQDATICRADGHPMNDASLAAFEGQEDITQ